MQFLTLLAVLWLASQFVEATRLKILLQRERSFDHSMDSNRLKRSTCEKSCIKSSSCQCIDYQERMDYNFPDYISSLANSSYVNVFQSSSVDTSISTLLEYKIAGTSNLRALDVINGLETNPNCIDTLIYGGCVRDIIRGVDLDDINDIDFEVFCSSETVMSHCEQHFGKSLCKYGTRNNWVTIGDENSVMAGETTMDAVPLTLVFEDYFERQNYLEFTTNSLFYDRTDSVIIDVSGTGMEDTCGCHVRIPIGANMEIWNSDRALAYGLKRYRYFKLLVKRFIAVEETQNFILMKIKDEIETDQLSFFMCVAVVRGEFDNSAHKCTNASLKRCKLLPTYEAQIEDQLGAAFYDDHDIASRLEEAIPQCNTAPSGGGSIGPALLLVTSVVLLVVVIVL